MENVILYGRVSSEDQAKKGTSLRYQKERLYKHCEMMGYNVVQYYEEDYSAKNFDNRPEFNRLLNFVKANKGLVNKLLIMRWDRFSRNVSEAWNKILMFQKIGIEVNTIEHPIDYRIPEQKMMLSIYLTIPEIDNDRRAMNTRNGIRKNNREGRWVNCAPTGYKNSRDAFNKPILIKSEVAPLVAKTFTLFATGIYPIAVLLRQMNSEGLKVSETRFNNMLRNPIYYGKILVKARADEPEELVQGTNFEPIVSEELFEEVQAVLQKKNE